MLYYRVFYYRRSALVGEPGHPLYLHRPQGKSRIDNPAFYDVWYLAAEASAAIGETFWDFYEWSNDMFIVKRGICRALGVYQLPDDLSILDLDNAQILMARGLHPRDIVTRNRSITQEWARQVWQEVGGPGGAYSRMWKGVSWWSYHNPAWTSLGVWGQEPAIQDVQRLSVSHPAVKDAATVMRRRIV